MRERSADLSVVGVGLSGQRMTIEEVIKEYDVQREDVLACIAYGAEMSRQRDVDIPMETAK